MAIPQKECANKQGGEGVERGSRRESEERIKAGDARRSGSWIKRVLVTASDRVRKRCSPKALETLMLFFCFLSVPFPTSSLVPLSLCLRTQLAGHASASPKSLFASSPFRAQVLFLTFLSGLFCPFYLPSTTSVYLSSAIYCPLWLLALFASLLISLLNVHVVTLATVYSSGSGG